MSCLLDLIVLAHLKHEIGTLREAILLRRACEDRFERRNDGCIELSLDSLCEPKACDATWHRFAIWAVRSHRVVRVGDGDDSRQQRDLVACKSIRIAVAVESLMVVANN